MAEPQPERATLEESAGPQYSPATLPPRSGLRGAEKNPWSRKDIWLLIALLIFSGGLRLVRLAEPRAVVFDETYYAKDACLYLGYDKTRCGLDQDTEQSYVHPPLGKWLIAIGIRVFGYDHFGWRASSAFAGTALVAVAYLLARKLFEDTWTAAVTGFLVSADYLLIVQSRIAMLDIFLALFVTLGFLFLAYDRERLKAIRDRLADNPDDEQVSVDLPTREVEWRFLAGSCFGLALAVKWSAAWALMGAGLMASVWSLSVWRMLRRTGKARSFALREMAATAGALILLPLIIYTTSYTKYFTDSLGNKCPYAGPQLTELKGKTPRLDLGVPAGQCRTGVKGTTFAFVDLHERMLTYHRTLTADHTYKSKAWTWPLVKRPVAYHYEGEPKAVHILAFGNPIVWWASIGAALWLVIAAVSRRRWRPERVVAVGWSSQYLPWLLVQRPLFFFYMTPVVPFMMLGLAAGLRELRDLGRVPKILVNLYLAIGVGILLIYFYPVIAAVGLSPNLWRSRMWFGSWI